MFPRLLASRGVLLIYIVHTLGITALIASEYISHAITDPWAITVQNVVDDGDTIGILLIAMGVLLECRETLLKRAMRERNQEDDGLHLSHMERDLEYYGVVLLMIGLTIEMMVAILNYAAEHFKSNPLFLSIEPSFNMITITAISLLMIAAITAMIQVIILMYLRRKTA